MMSSTSWALFATVFVACVVEAVEALTIVLAAGTRDHRSVAQGVLAALVALAAIVGIAGPAVSAIPLDPLRIVIGGLLLVFGLQWLRKSVLRASGHKALHDEAAAYARELDAARSAASGRRWVVADWYAFTLSFKGVLLEGLEVVFIVITFGTNGRDLPVAVLGAAAAVVLVSGVGVAVRAPLAKVPENAMKFVVGTMLTGFGAFWSAEGAGASWPGSDTALLVLIPAIAVAGLVAIAILRARTRPAAPQPAPTPMAHPAGRSAAGDRL